MGDVDNKETSALMNNYGINAETADAIFRLTSLAKFDQRFVIPTAHREEAIEMLEATDDVKGNTGFGIINKPERGF